MNLVDKDSLIILLIIFVWKYYHIIGKWLGHCIRSSLLSLCFHVKKGCNSSQTDYFTFLYSFVNKFRGVCKGMNS